MPQHFLLSAAARTLSLSAVARMSDEEAHARFTAIRWADNDGKPYCPECGCLKVYAFATRKLWKCAGCRYQFSVTARTIFADRKRPIRDYLLAIAIFANGAKGHSALQLSRDLDCQYKTAFVLAHKLREAMGSQVHNPDEPELAGTVAIDGAYFGGKVKQANRKADRTDRRAAEEQTGKRQVVVVARERQGDARTWVVGSEGEAVPMIRASIASGTEVHADKLGAWNVLHASYPMKRVNHSVEYKGEDGACTNQAESYFSRLRRSEMGIHHRISGHRLQAYADEMAWRENHRRQPNGTHWNLITAAALAHPKSAVWAGYWHREKAA